MVSVVGFVLLALHVVAVVGSFGFAWYSWRRADHPVSDRFAWVMLADGTWALLALLELVGPTDELSVFWMTPMALVAPLAAVCWFRFVVEYTGDSERIPDVLERVAVAHAPVYAGLYALNPSDIAYSARDVATFAGLRLPYATFGPLVVGELLVLYGILGVSFALLGRFFIRTRNLYRKQTGVIFGVTALVVVANVAYFTGLSPHPRLDLTPVFFASQAVGVGVALYRYDFLDVAPLAANTLLEDMADPVFVVDSKGRVVDYNAAAGEFVEQTRQPTLEDVAIPDLAAAIDNGDRSGAFEGAEVTTALRAGGRYVPVTYDVRTTPVTDRYGIVRGRVIVLRDVTERRERKQALEDQNRQLESFTGIVSHDLRNPLQVVSGKIELARQTGNLDYLDDASDSVVRMEQMLDDLLQLAREGQTIGEKTEIDLPTCCREAWAAVGTDGARLAIETEMTVLADPDRLRQVFENLFRNAVEHGMPDERPTVGPGGEPALTVTVGETETGFFVADDGPGVPPSERDAVFDFGVTTVEDGSGFGLAIVDRIVRAHGWDIALTAESGGGARFEVTIPCPEPSGV
ncbi:sensor histidine kinase [Haloarcula salina]|uniref:histidine kinase n=1 Tax=Haloarcula salina TaxID=1429914 RepID=A0AA41KG34_9EURY|nr:histidine kinase N-terminal 7TM domain-containing protein [Haloarcula salina]MBV0900296.1 PAS domain-containing protein [Haloarcula salina]